MGNRIYSKHAWNHMTQTWTHDKEMKGEVGGPVNLGGGGISGTMMPYCYLSNFVDSFKNRIIKK